MNRHAQDSMLSRALRAFRAGNLNQAAAMVEQILKLEPKQADALSLNGMIAYERGSYDEADRWYRKAIAANRREPLYHCNLGMNEKARGRINQALACYEKALKLHPDHPEALAGKAEALEARGKVQRARTLIEPTARASRPPSRIASVYTRLLKNDGDEEALIDFATAQLERNDLRPDHRRSIMFLLAGALERRGSYDDAFGIVSRANGEIQRPYNFDVEREKAENLMRLFSRRKIGQYPRADHGSELPVFIVGMPRSGSTLIEQIIHAHPEGCGAGEIHDLVNVLRGMGESIGSSRSYPFCVDELRPEHMNPLADQYLSAIRRFSSNASRIADKLLVNYERLGIISLLFPQARVIVARRHPLDTCLSCFLHDLSPELVRYSTDLRHLGLQYRVYQQLMNHWRETIDLPILEVDYESLVCDFESETRRVIAFLNLEWDEKCLRFYEAKRDVTTISYDQVRRPIYKSSLKRHERFGRHLDALRDALGDVLETHESSSNI